MHDIGTIVWIVLVVIGVISSMRKNMRQARARRAPATQPVAAPPPAPPPVVAPPPAVPPPVPAPAALDRPKPPPAQLPAIGTSPIRGMFGGAQTLVRAIVAAEVLGPPKSLQEQTIWSPRHNEPSI